MPKYKPLIDVPVSLRNTTSRNETVKQREGNKLYQGACLSQFTIQCQEIKSTRSVVAGVFHSYNSPYNQTIKDGIFLD